jgi:hypothetical protein
MKVSWRTEWLSVTLIALMCVLSAIAWDAVPDRMAVHWGPAGTPDRLGNRAEGLLAMPAIAGAVYAVMIVLPRFDPLRANYARFSNAYPGPGHTGWAAGSSSRRESRSRCSRCYERLASSPS